MPTRTSATTTRSNRLSRQVASRQRQAGSDETQIVITPSSSLRRPSIRTRAHAGQPQRSVRKWFNVRSPGGTDAVVGDDLPTEGQAALRRVATLVAEGAASAEVLAAVVDEV